MHDAHSGVHHLLHVVRRTGISALKQLDGHSPIPNCPVGRAAQGLILWRKQGFDLIIGLIDGPRAAGLVVALTAKF
jgi:hypothetical protein